VRRRASPIKLTDEGTKMKLRKPIGWLASLVLALLAFGAQALTLSPTTLTLSPGQTGTISLYRVSGTASLTGNTSPGVATASLASNKLTVTAVAGGTTTLSVRDQRGTVSAKVTVRAPMSVSPASVSLSVGQSATLTVLDAQGSIQVGSSNSGVASATVSGNLVTVTARAAGTAAITVRDSATQLSVAVTVASVAASEPHPGRLLASNCFQCHGTNGSGGFDGLRGSNEILSELRKFASGAEDPTGIMAAHAKGYTDEQMQLIADFFAKQ
jgi:cytochrome c553